MTELRLDVTIDTMREDMGKLRQRIAEAEEIIKVAQFVIPKCIGFGGGCRECAFHNRGVCYSTQEFQVKANEWLEENK